MKTILSDSVFLNKIIHDSVDTGTPATLSNGQRTQFTSDGLGYEFIHGGRLWVDNKITDGAVNNIVTCKISATLNTSQLDKNVQGEIVIASDPEIPVDTFQWTIHKQNTDVRYTFSTILYVGAEALQYGFKIYLTSDNDITISGKAVLLTR